MTKKDKDQRVERIVLVGSRCIRQVRPGSTAVVNVRNRGWADEDSPIVLFRNRHLVNTDKELLKQTRFIEPRVFPRSKTKIFMLSPDLMDKIVRDTLEQKRREAPESPE